MIGITISLWDGSRPIERVDLQERKKIVGQSGHCSLSQRPSNPLFDGATRLLSESTDSGKKPLCRTGRISKAGDERTNIRVIDIVGLTQMGQRQARDGRGRRKWRGE